MTLSILYCGEQPDIDIVGVESFSERPNQCWTAYEGETEINWLSDLKFLPSKVTNARIMSFWHVLEGFSAHTLSVGLLKELESHRRLDEEVEHHYTRPLTSYLEG